MIRQLSPDLATRQIKTFRRAAPPLWVEYTYYALIFYGIMGSGLGVSLPMLAGGMMVVLAAVCILRQGSRAIAVHKPIALPLACALSFLAVQVVVYDEPLTGGILRSMITWILGLLIVQSLCLRQGVLHRLAIVLFTIGLITLPYLTFQGGEVGTERASAEQSMISGDLTNPNGLGAWFGFCAVYFAIVGVETQRNAVRIAAWLVAVGCLYIVGLTVSRGALFATAVGIVFAVRRLLKRGFIPLLVFIIMSWIIYEFGLFERLTSLYAARGMEETGRLLVWPVAIDRYFSSPLIGVGASNVATYVPFSGRLYTPHNSFIYFALSSGVVPLALFVACWIRAARNAFSYGEQTQKGPFRVPLLAYTLCISLIGDLAFLQPWGLLTFSIILTPDTPANGQSFLVQHVRRPRGVHHSGQRTQGGRPLRYGLRL